MARALERSGLDKEATFYALRHLYISRAIEGEVPLNVIADNCGTSIRMIETTYAKVIAGSSIPLGSAKKIRHLIEISESLRACPIDVQ